MAVPGFEEFMFPILKYLADGNEHYKKDIINEISKSMNLTQEQLDEKVPSQTEPTYINRISWALTYLKKAGLLNSPARAHFQITQEGQIVVKKNISSLNTKYLKKYESFLEFVKTTERQSVKKGNSENAEKEEQTPYEKMIECNEIIKKSVCDDLLNKILEQSPYFFEQLVINLIVAMGYGGNIEDAGKATKKSGDEGIDGLVKEDKLGLETIYIQAKRYSRDNYVGHPAIQQFIGALQLKGSKKGIFITTSDFTKQAIDAIEHNTNISVVLINGKKLVDLMYEYNIGVSTEKKFEIKRIDSDYFDSI